MVSSTNASVSSATASPSDLRQIRQMHEELSRQFYQGEWGGLASSLESLSRAAEYAGNQELCLRAQSISEILGYRGGGRTAGGRDSGERLAELMEDLLSRVSHWSWSIGSQVTH